MEIKDLPVLTIREIDPGGCVLRGNVDRWQWVGERHFGVLYLGDGRLLGGRFKDVQERDRRVAFVPDAPGEAVGIKPGAPLPYFDGYWGERAILALDPRIQWRAVEFEAHDATMHHSDGRQERVLGVWDHDHCDICWVTIDKVSNTRHMLSDQKDHICCDCHARYVLARSIAFIPDDPARGKM